MVRPRMNDTYFVPLSDRVLWTEQSVDEHGKLNVDLQNFNWRGNFYRIDVPQGGNKEYSCWSPTMASPACFHKPLYFGAIVLQ